MLVVFSCHRGETEVRDERSIGLVVSPPEAAQYLWWLSDLWCTLGARRVHVCHPSHFAMRLAARESSSNCEMKIVCVRLVPDTNIFKQSRVGKIIGWEAPCCTLQSDWHNIT